MIGDDVWDSKIMKVENNEVYQFSVYSYGLKNTLGPITNTIDFKEINQ